MRQQLTGALLLFVIMGVPAWAQNQKKNDWLIVPGQRVGPIKADTTRSDLDLIFGGENVHDQEVERGEVGPEPATVVFATRPRQTLAIFWENDRILDIDICYLRSSGCFWRTQNGVTIGTSVVRLEQLNAVPFQIEPWGTDGGGNITSWRDGKLRPSFGDNGQYHLLLRICWKESPSGPNSQQPKWIKKIDLARGKLTSATPALRRLRPSVTEMTLFFR
jgi:hypothetical protein